MSKEYISNALDVIQYLLDHTGYFIMDREIYEISPRYGKKIINNLIDEEIVVSTKDGLLFDEEDIWGLNSYLSDMKEELSDIEKTEKAELLNKIGAISNIIAPFLK